MAINPLLASLGASAVGALFGKKPRYDPMQKRQIAVSDELFQLAHSAPGSDPGEQAALAEMRARLGQQQQGQRDQFLSAMPMFAQGATGDMLTNLGVQQQGQMMALDLAHMVDAQRRRKQYLLDSAAVARGVGPREQQPNDVGAALSGMAYQYGQQYEQRRADRLAAGVGAQSGGGQPAPSGSLGTITADAGSQVRFGPFGANLVGPAAEPPGSGGTLDLGVGMEPTAMAAAPEMVSNPLMGAGAPSAWNDLLQQVRPGAEPIGPAYSISQFTRPTGGVDRWGQTAGRQMTGIKRKRKY